MKMNLIVNLNVSRWCRDDTDLLSTYLHRLTAKGKDSVRTGTPPFYVCASFPASFHVLTVPTIVDKIMFAI